MADLAVFVRPFGRLYQDPSFQLQVVMHLAAVWLELDRFPAGQTHQGNLLFSQVCE